MRFQSYFNSAINIIQLYDGTMPLQHFLKQYFSRHKKHGSRDRKIITHLCYNFFRLGKAFFNIPIAEKLKLAIFICNNDISEWAFLYEENWLVNHTGHLAERLSFVQSIFSFSLQDVFPFYNEVSTTLDAAAFTKSLFVQPDVFIRIRPGYNTAVISTLQQHAVPYNHIAERCISFSPAVPVSTMLNMDKEAVIQDYSSQQVEAFLKLAAEAGGNQNSAIQTWDCCAGSGGKSILAYDTLNHINLTASDIRASIIQNLKQRFAKAGIKNYNAFVFDTASVNCPEPGIFYNLIICDAPCTGSGTWSRTPEQLYFFNTITIKEYAARQQNIVRNAVKCLHKNGFFLYITCSVFEKENEAIAAFVQQKLQLQLLKMEVLKGYSKKADTMFAALFRKY